MFQFIKNLLSKFRREEDVELKYFRKYSRLINPAIYNELLRQYAREDIIFEPIRHKVSREVLDKLYSKIDKADFLSNEEKFDTIMAFMNLTDGSLPESKVITSRFEKIFGKEFLKAIYEKNEEFRSEIAVKKFIRFIKSR